MNYLILAAGKSKRFGRNKLEEQFNGKTLPRLAVEFALKNGAKNIFMTLSKSDVRTRESEIFHPVLDSISPIYKPRILFQNEEQYGPGAAITKWAGLIDGPFIVLFGDNYYQGDIDPLHFDHFSDPEDKATYFTTKIKERDPRNLQLAAVCNNYIIEKPHSFLEGEYFCGMVRFPAGCFEKFHLLQKSDRGEIEIADMVNMSEHPWAVNLDKLGVLWDDLTYTSDIDRVRNLVINRHLCYG